MNTILHESQINLNIDYELLYKEEFDYNEVFAIYTIEEHRYDYIIVWENSSDGTSVVYPYNVVSRNMNITDVIGVYCSESQLANVIEFIIEDKLTASDAQINSMLDGLNTQLSAQLL